MTATTADLVAVYGVLNTLALHSRGVDRADANLLAAAYHSDATVDYGFFAGPAASLVAILAGAQKSSGPTLHRTSNCWIKTKGDRAISESYVIAYVEEPAHQRLVFGRYLDRHALRGGEWRLAHRTYILDGNTNRQNAAVRPDPPVNQENFLPYGAKGAADPGRALMAAAAAANSRLKGYKAMTPSPADLDAALSRLQIHNLSMAYCRGVDRADAALLKSLFLDDAIVISGVVNGTGAEFADGVTAYVRDNLDYCFHSVANEWVEIDGDTAIGELYVIAHMTAAGNDVMTGGRYLDSYERRDGAWKIKHRTFVMDWNTVHPTTFEKAGFYEALKNRGRWGRTDPVYAHWESL